MALRITDEQGFPTLSTFKDLYPGDYSGTAEGLPVPEDYSSYQLYNSPMMQRERAREEAMRPKRYEEQIPYQPDIWQRTMRPQGAREDYMRAAQQYNTKQDEQATRDAQTDLNIMKALQAAPPGRRDPILKLYQRFNQQRGQTIDPELLKFYKQADTDDFSAAQWAAQEFLKLHPDLDEQKANKIINTNPGALAEYLSLIEKGKEAKLKNEQTELENRIYQQTGDALSEAPGGATEAPQPSPMQGQPPAPQRPLQTSQGPSQPSQRAVAFNRMVDTIGQRMGASPHIIQMVKASAAMETDDYDFNAVSPKGAKGPGQFMPDTAKRYNVNDPTLPGEAITGMIKYYTDLEKMFPGKPELQLAAYNAGEGAVQKAGGVPNFPETQRYVQRGMQYLSGLPKPHSESVAQAPDQTRQAVQFYDQKINQLQSQLDRLPAGAAMIPKLRAVIEQLQKRQEFYMKRQESIEKRYEDKPDAAVLRAATELFPETPWVNLKPKEKQAAILYERTLREEADERKAELHGRRATTDKILTPEENRQYGTPPGTTQGDLAGQKGQIEQRVDLPSAQQTKVDGYTATYRLTNKLTSQLQDPETRQALAPVIGKIFSDPQAWYERLKGRKVTGLTDAQQRFAAGLALQMIDLRKEFLGTAQSAQELSAAEGFLADLSEATPDTILNKLLGIQDYVYIKHDSLVDIAESQKQRTPPRLPKPQGFGEFVREKKDAPAEQTPAPSGKTPNPIKEALESYEKTRKKR